MIPSRLHCFMVDGLQILQHRPEATHMEWPGPVGAGFALSGTMDVYRTPLGRKAIGCAIEVHAALGPGLLESMYQRCLAHEFRLNGISFRTQVALPIEYRASASGSSIAWTS
jgi:hypothetical protein